MNIFKEIRRSIALRLVIPVGLVVIIAVTLHILLLSSHKQVFDSKLRESERVGSIIKAVMLYDMERNHLHDFQTYINMLPLGEDLSAIRIYNHQGTLKYAVGDINTGQYFDRSINPICVGCHGVQRKAAPIKQNVRKEESGRFVFQAAFPLENQVECQSCHSTNQRYLGNLLTELTFSPLELRLLDRRRNMIYFGSLVMVIALFIIWALIQYQVVRPLKNLVQVIERSKQGELSVRIPSKRRDELGFLIHSYNEMMDTLQEFQNNLEEQVKIRTKELESSRVQLLLRENLASLGRLAAGVAHELGNPLTGISSIVQLVKRRKKDDAFVVEQLNLVQDEIDRLARLSRQMVDLARPENTSTAAFNIKSSLKKAYQIARLDRKLKKRIIKLPSNDDPIIVRANEDAVIQIIMNLLFNAADFTAENGLITFDLKVNEEGMVELRVTDDGVGIPKEHQPRIFDPFFTGKKMGDGTGLGLSVSHSLARSFQGELILESSNADGTVFLLKVPIGRK